MLTGIDWLSFTVALPEKEVMSHQLHENVAAALYDFSPLVHYALVEEEVYETRIGRPPFPQGYVRDDHGVYIFAGTHHSHFLVEITGRGCQWFRERNEDASRFLTAVAPRLTRIDIATDILTDVRPTDFVALRDKSRFRTHSEFVSDTGETCYVGSKTSHCYSRVYRYSPPHERAQFLRIETVIKAQDAKSLAATVLDLGLQPVANSLGARFGWQHPCWQPEADSAAELKAWRPERHEGKTIYWLNSSVAPCLRKLAQNTGFDVQAWLDEFVLSPSEKDCTPL